MILGDFSNNLDEGYKNITFHISMELSSHHEVTKLNIKKIFTKHFWTDIKDINSPNIIHYMTAPSIPSLIVLKMFKFYWNDAKTVTSALYPNFSFLSKKFVPLFKPNIILTQSDKSDKIFKSLGCETRFLSNGVDTEKFVPVPKEEKTRLRKKYGIDREKFIILHVGHIEKKRCLKIFTKIQNKDNQIIIIGSKYIKVDQKIYDYLKNKGCIVHLGYIKNIEEIYALSDCYIFPVIKGGSILTPLSVMEAMSCNLPVITRDFDGLKRSFSQGDGLIFAKKENDFISALDIIKGGIDIKTREKVLPYSWKNVCSELEKIYNFIL